MGTNDAKKLNLAVLADGLPAITPAIGSALAEAGAVCLVDEGHAVGVEMKVEGEFIDSFEVLWPNVTYQMRRCWNDEREATEHGACAIALLLIRNLTNYTVIERARQGKGFDYWLGEVEDLPFQNKARLEVSGIRHGDDNQIKARVKEKVKQTERSSGLLPAYVIVVEFSKPISKVIKK